MVLSKDDEWRLWYDAKKKNYILVVRATCVFHQFTFLNFDHKKQVEQTVLKRSSINVILSELAVHMVDLFFAISVSLHLRTFCNVVSYEIVRTKMCRCITIIHARRMSSTGERNQVHTSRRIWQKHSFRRAITKSPVSLTAPIIRNMTWLRETAIHTGSL